MVSAFVRKKNKEGSQSGEENIDNYEREITNKGSPGLEQYDCRDVMISVRLSGRPAVSKNLTKTMVPNLIKFGMIITTIKLYAAIPLLVTFDLYIGHRVSICSKQTVSISQEPRMSST